MKPKNSFAAISSLRKWVLVVPFSADDELGHDIPL